MNKKPISSWVSYLITSVVALVLAGLFFALMIFNKDLYILDGESYMTVTKALINATFASGVIIFGFGLLTFSANAGTFYMLTYGIIMLFDLFRKDLNSRKYKTFYDYKVAQDEKKKPFNHMLIVGAVMLIISLIILLVTM